HLYQVAVLQFQIQRYGECQASIQRLVNDPRAEQEKVLININQNTRQEVPLKAAALNVLGVMHLDQNDKEKAKQAFSQSLQVYPDFLLPKGNLEQMNAPQNGAAAPRNGQVQPRMGGN